MNWLVDSWMLMVPMKSWLPSVPSDPGCNAIEVSCAALRCSGADHGTARDDIDKPILSSSTGSHMLQKGPELDRHGKENGSTS